MIVYGDAARRLSPQPALRALAAMRLADHAGVVERFIAGAEIGQGLLDAEFARLGQDEPTPLATAATAMVMALAEAVHRSWGGRPAAMGSIDAATAAVLALALPALIEAKQAEGYSFYALYPEAVLAAAQRLPDGPLRVIGIRSIGLGLGALVAVGRGAPPPISVRPVGHPFHRHLAVSAQLLEAVLDDPAAVIAVVDEGPGLSGSSFGAVLDTLEAHGVARSRIHLLPGHAGPLGPQADDARRQRWDALPRHVVAFDNWAVAPDASPLRRWAEAIVGPVAGIEDVSGGAWRARLVADPGAWPPVNPSQERRKFLAETTGGAVLLKFAGLGPGAGAKTGQARLLGEAGFSPPLLGVAHGFHITSWYGDAVQLVTGADVPLPRLAEYLAVRAGHFPAEPDQGASGEALATMLAHNGRLALGDAAGPALDAAADRLRRLAPQPRIATDNRLHLWEWLRLPDGRVLKTDTVDHCVGHDLIGCQPLAWDVAGAKVELGLDDAATDELLQRLAAAGTPVDQETVSTLLPAYLAFELGLWRLTADGLTGWPEEHCRAQARFDGLRRDLQAVLSR